MVQHIVDRGVGERQNIRKRCHEPVVVWNDGGNLGLLQHDLRHPYTVWRGIVLPRKVFSSVLIEPCQYGVRKCGHGLLFGLLAQGQRLNSIYCIFAA